MTALGYSSPVSEPSARSKVLEATNVAPLMEERKTPGVLEDMRLVCGWYLIRKIWWRRWRLPKQRTPTWKNEHSLDDALVSSGGPSQECPGRGLPQADWMGQVENVEKPEKDEDDLQWKIRLEWITRKIYDSKATSKRFKGDIQQWL